MNTTEETQTGHQATVRNSGSGKHSAHGKRQRPVPYANAVVFGGLDQVGQRFGEAANEDKRVSNAGNDSGE
ncbi:hypothetical protein [Paraburkholderia sp.]|uniref:hypothetical protein n=1 Tax=Paraburkholderia sp. TaxID=1926495 RepID=UPI0025D5A251|nr:hypothetical protein [Paraburkholderia sp.]